ncbi:uncharacterized protein LOC117586601 [Drosophila guanche]|uniref:Uncharacterized protein n=1 Tax=Drosophila guanche TaxID=7266 RepID=A0A3B0KJU1_DROGU|nr:uncharacterized protein LOC117586601 [Drosophila guanche]SPP84028.1 Hypothetical predicted protein [Drosophila guanche]
MNNCTTINCPCKSRKGEAHECFYDCNSDTEGDDNGAPGGDVCKVVAHQEDPSHMRAVLENALHATQNLLGCYGSPVAPTVRNPAPPGMHYYPATLEVSVTLNSEQSCLCPKHRRCRLRGDPVKLKLPIELNPESGQVKVNIFQPRPVVTISDCRQCGAGLPDDAGDRCNTKKRKSCSCVRKVRWCKEEPREG